MGRSVLTAAATGAVILLALARTGAAAGAASADTRPAPGTRPAAGEALFDPHRLHVAHVRLSAEAWEGMQPQGRGAREGFGWLGLGGATATTRPATQPAVERLAGNSYGYRHAYVRGELTFDGQTYRDVAVRFKGNSSYFLSSKGLKRPMKIDLGRHVPGQAIDGVRVMNLHNNALDASELREAVGYWIYRRAGVPAPRTGFVLVRLTVEGRPELRDRCLGLYTLTEEVDAAFLASRFGREDGLLLKPEGGIPDYRGGGAEALRAYDPETEATPATLAGLERFSRAAHAPAGGEAFERALAASADVDALLRFLAATVYVANLDSILATDHNFFLHIGAGDGRATFIPWDVGLGLGAYGRYGSGEEQAMLSIDRPRAGGSARLITRVLETPRLREGYRRHLDSFTRTFLSPEEARREVEAMGRVVEEARRLSGDSPDARPPLTSPSGRRLWRQAPPPAEFLALRTASVRGQLAGTETGYIPRARTGPISSFNGQEPRYAAPAWAGRAYAALDADGDGRLTVLEAETGAAAFHDAAAAIGGERAEKGLNEAVLAEAFRAILPAERAGAAGAGAGARPPLFRRERRPAMPERSLASATLWEADRELDGVVTRQELTFAARRLFLDADADEDGALTQAEFGALAGRLARGGR